METPTTPYNPLSTDELHVLHLTNKNLPNNPVLPTNTGTIMTPATPQYQPKISNNVAPTYSSMLQWLNCQPPDHFITDFSHLNLDTETTAPPSQTAFVPISTDDKIRMYRPWQLSVIIKTFEANVGYKYLSKKLPELWQPSEPLALIDLGQDFFLIKFQKQENYSKAIHQVPWFLGNHFLAVHQWQPNFTPSSANFTSTVIWARLPQLPTEYYDPTVLTKIGNTIGTLLRLDMYARRSTRQLR